jgi:hypothetical protein
MIRKELEELFTKISQDKQFTDEERMSAYNANVSHPIPNYVLATNDGSDDSQRGFRE